MPQRPHTRLVVIDHKFDLAGSIEALWSKKQFRPTIVLLGTRKIADGVFEIPFVNYEVADGRSLIPPQRVIKRNESVDRAAWALLEDGFLFLLPPRFERPRVSCLGYYDYPMDSERRPEGFSKGKRYYFAELPIDDLAHLAAKPREMQRDPNPVRIMTTFSDLGSIRGTLGHVASEDKRWVWNDAITCALQLRFYREKQAA